MNKELIDIQIVTTTSSKDPLIPHPLFRDDEILTIGIEQYCEKNNLNPIYIDKSIAIFDDHLLIAAYPEEV